MADNNDKNFPASSQGIRGLLNMEPESQPTQQVAEDGNNIIEHSMSATPDAPANLPFLESEVLEPQTPQDRAIRGELITPAKPTDPEPHQVHITGTSPIDQLTGPAHDKGNELYALVLKIAKTILPYVLIFGIALGLYYFYFSDFSFNSLFGNNSLRIESVAKSDQSKDLEKLQEDTKADYLNWMSQFFADVNDDAIISMQADVSGNGLTNFDKYLLNLNPKVYSTRGNIGDGQAVIEGTNPWTGKPFTDRQKELVDKYINKELISNRITAAALTRGVTKYAQYVNSDSPYYIDPETLRQLQRDNPIITAPDANLSTITGVGDVAANSSSAVNIKGGESIDKTKPGLLEIPANKVSVPLTWTKDPKDFDKDLEKGLVHYPGTALPGEVGTSYISGHSSGYFWNKSPYKQVFAVLGQVKDGTSFTITATQLDGKTVKFNYIVMRRGEFAADDQAQFLSTAESIVALSTCWPVGTTDRRLVLFSKLTQVERY